MFEHNKTKLSFRVLVQGEVNDPPDPEETEIEMNGALKIFQIKSAFQ